MHEPVNKAATDTGTEDPFTAGIRRHLEASLQTLDAPARARLAAARRTALAAVPGPSRPAAGFIPAAIDWLLPAGALASITAMLLALGLLVNTAPLNNAGTPRIPDALELDLLSSNENFETYEDLDFYLWLAADEQAG